jgi:glutathione S-transferase
MLELWQTEWCPASRRVRQRLTELGIDYLIRQVPVEKEQRHALRRATGTDTIPALVFASGEIAVGEDLILRLLGDPVPQSGDADAHQQKAEKARRRYLEEKCECSQPATR